MSENQDNKQDDFAEVTAPAPKTAMPVASTAPVVKKRRWPRPMSVLLGVFWSFVAVVAAVAMVTPYSTLRRQGVAVGPALLAAIVVFPVAPLVWQWLIGRRARANDLRSRPRTGFVIRTFVVALFVWGSAVAALGPQVWLQIVTDRTGTGALVYGGLWQSLRFWADKTDLHMVPPDATMFASATLGRWPLDKAAGFKGGSAILDLAGKVKAMDACDARWRDGKVWAASAASDRFTIGLYLPGVSSDAGINCYLKALGGVFLGQGVVQIDKSQTPWRVKLPEGMAAAATAEQAFYVTDSDTLVVVNQGWDAAMRRLLSGEGKGAADGSLRIPFRRAKTQSALWGVGTFDDRALVVRDVAFDLALGPDGVRLGATMQTKADGDERTLARARIEIPPQALESAGQGALKGFFSGGLPGVFQGLISPPVIPGPP